MDNKHTSDIKRKIAIAIEDSRDTDNKAKITAKGIGKLAEKIISVAKEHNIPIKEDADLIEILGKINVNQDIPDELYPLIAEVLKFFYTLNQKAEEQLKQQEEESKPKETPQEPEPKPEKKEKWVITSIEDVEDNNKKNK